MARTLRLVESSQSMIRIVGLSATLPNYLDVALFLRVNPQSGLFHFGPAYRPVPLTQTFVGVTTPNAQKRKDDMLEIAYDKALAALRNGKQVTLTLTTAPCNPTPTPTPYPIPHTPYPYPYP